MSGNAQRNAINTYKFVEVTPSGCHDDVITLQLCLDIYWVVSFGKCLQIYPLEVFVPKNGFYPTREVRHCLNWLLFPKRWQKLTIIPKFVVKPFAPSQCLLTQEEALRRCENHNDNFRYDCQLLLMLSKEQPMLTMKKSNSFTAQAYHLSSVWK